MVDEARRDLRYYSRILELRGFEVQRVASYEEGAACLLACLLACFAGTSTSRLWGKKGLSLCADSQWH